MVALGTAAVALPSSLRAQAAWPTSPVTFVVGYAPGDSNDISARELAHLMSPILGPQIIVDNKGGANGSLGLRAVANAKPDGYRLSCTSAQTIVVNRWVQKGMIDTLTTLGSYLPALKDGFAPFEQGDYSGTIKTLAPLAGENERVGGSRAQHDLIEFTLLRAYLGANRLSEARRLLSERRAGASGIPVLGVAAVC
ncbi:MAG: tripartite tricarboxylate transporter substrate-binding protein [Reyranella sp.]|nr:tripartite tricarboxylate transporter substrate-binding protein [Reyranella sp.]